MVEHTLHPLSAEVDTLPVLGSLGLLMINSEHMLNAIFDILPQNRMTTTLI